MTGRPLVGKPAPTPEPTPTLVLPGYSHFVLWAQHSSHEAFSLRTHTRPMPNISTETKCHRQTYLWHYIACNTQRTYQPPPPPPRGDDVSWTALQPPCALSWPQPWPLQPQPPNARPRSAHSASTAHTPP